MLFVQAARSAEEGKKNAAAAEQELREQALNSVMMTGPCEKGPAGETPESPQDKGSRKRLSMSTTGASPKGDFEEYGWMWLCQGQWAAYLVGGGDAIIFVN